jgi:hypothetical protein
MVPVLCIYVWCFDLVSAFRYWVRCPGSGPIVPSRGTYVPDLHTVGSIFRIRIISQIWWSLEPKFDVPNPEPMFQIRNRCYKSEIDVPNPKSMFLIQIVYWCVSDVPDIVLKNKNTFLLKTGPGFWLKINLNCFGIGVKIKQNKKFYEAQMSDTLAGVDRKQVWVWGRKDAILSIEWIRKSCRIMCENVGVECLLPVHFTI